MPWPKGKKFSHEHIDKRSKSIIATGKRRKKPITIDGLEYWKCGTCKIYKPASEFYADGKTASGVSSVCRNCHNKCSVATRDKEHHREMNAEYERKSRIKNIAVYRANERERSRARRESGSLNIRARRELNNALKRGDIVKPDRCESCKETKKLTGHHNDYSKPLSVEWLCYKCHGKKHRRDNVIEFKRVK